MTTSLILTAIIGLVVGAFLTKFLTILAGISVTVTRPTTSDGESVQLTRLVSARADAMRIANAIETLSLAAQARIVRQNEILLQSTAMISHEKWLRISRKLDAGAKLTGPERNWWADHAKDYDEDGVKVGVKDAQIIEAAESPRE